MEFVAHWRNWIRPVAICIYFILMVIAIPLCILEVANDNKTKHVKAWFTGGVFVLLAVPVSLWEIILHVIHYTQPSLQKHIIRIIWMVPIYALNAWFALRFKEVAIYLDTARECYEAYVIYNFMAYLLSYLTSEFPQLEVTLSKIRQQKHFLPVICLPAWPMGRKFLYNCKLGVLQYTVVRLVTTVIAFICELVGKYDEGDFNFKSAWSYLVIFNNLSQIWAMYCLILFYMGTKTLLAPIKPVPKFLCVKFVIFFSFWQAIVIAVLAKCDVIKKNEFYGDEIATAVQDFCICVEMFIASVMHYFAFSHKPFINPEAPQGNCCESFLSMWDVSDVKKDVVEHVKSISMKVKKTVSGPFQRTNDDTEKTPLLVTDTGYQHSYSIENYRVPAEMTQVDVHISGFEGEQNVLSPTDWDTTSVDRWQPNRPVTKSVTSSMHNYLESSDNQSMHSQAFGNELCNDSEPAIIHVSNTDHKHLPNDTDLSELGHNKIFIDSMDKNRMLSNNGKECQVAESEAVIDQSDKVTNSKVINDK